MKSPYWLSAESIRVLHALVVDAHGGDAAMRDERRIDAVVARPRQQYAYGEESLARLAAAYAAGIVQGHPFVDGNKRTGFLAAAAFLELNGRSFVATQPLVVSQTQGLASGAVSEIQYAEWLEKSLRPVGVKPKKPRK